MRGEPLQGYCRAIVEADSVRKRHDFRGLHDIIFGIRTETPLIRDTIAALEVAHSLADGLDLSRSLDSQRERERNRPGQRAVAKVNVRVIHSGGVNANQDLAFPRLRLRHFLQLQFFRSAIFCDSYRFHLTTSPSLSLRADRARVFLPAAGRAGLSM